MFWFLVFTFQPTKQPLSIFAVPHSRHEVGDQTIRVSYKTGSRKAFHYECITMHKQTHTRAHPHLHTRVKYDGAKAYACSCVCWRLFLHSCGYLISVIFLQFHFALIVRLPFRHFFWLFHACLRVCVFCRFFTHSVHKSSKYMLM